MIMRGCREGYKIKSCLESLEWEFWKGWRTLERECTKSTRCMQRHPNPNFSHLKPSNQLHPVTGQAFGHYISNSSCYDMLTVSTQCAYCQCLLQHQANTIPHTIFQTYRNTRFYAPTQLASNLSTECFKTIVGPPFWVHQKHQVHATLPKP